MCRCGDMGMCRCGDVEMWKCRNGARLNYCKVCLLHYEIIAVCKANGGNGYIKKNYIG